MRQDSKSIGLWGSREGISRICRTSSSIEIPCRAASRYPCFMPARPSRTRALAIVLVLYACAQLLSFFLLVSAKPYSAGRLWTFGALGPLAAVTAIPRFQYHSLVSNVLFVAFCAVVLAGPFAYAMRPRRWTLAVTVIGLVMWWVFGIGFTIDHL